MLRLSRNDNERLSRSERHRASQDGQDFQDIYGKASSEPRRRRTQAARLQSDTDDMIDTVVPLSRGSTGTQQRYTPPKQEQPSWLKQDAQPSNGRYRVRYDEISDDEDDDYEDLPKRRMRNTNEEPPEKRHILRWVIIGIFIVAFLAGATYIGTQRPDLIETVVGKARDLIAGPTPSPEPSPSPSPSPEPTPEPPPDASAAVIIGFLANPAQQPDINEPITFTITTTLQTNRVQIVDDNGQVLIEQTDTGYVDTPNGRVWNLMVYFPTPYKGNLEAYPGNEAGWNDANGAVNIVAVGDTEAPVETAAADDGTAMVAAQGSASESVPVSSVSVSETVLDKAGELSSYTREKTINFGDADVYKGFYKAAGMDGILAFRGSNMRQNAAFGTVAPEELKLTTQWAANVGSNSAEQDTFAVQPLIVKWHANIREMMALNEDKRTKDLLREVIYASNDGNVYFFDLDDGSPTRDILTMDPIVPMLSSPSVHPAGIPILFVGTGDPKAPSTDGQTGMQAYNLLGNSKMALLRGKREEAYSSNEAFITSPLVDTQADVVVTVGGNGLVYTLLLNTESSSEQNTLVFEPELTYYRSKVGEEDTSILSSLAAYGEMAYFASQGGILQALNLNTFTNKWAVNLGGKTDAAIALETGDGGTALYTATNGDGSGNSVVRRLDADTGEMIWSATLSGAIHASPLVGQNGVSDLVFFTADGSTLYALSKETGEITWQHALNGKKVSSPLAVYDGQGNAFVLQGDESGLTLLEGKTGNKIDYLETDGAPVGSPASFDSLIVFATDAGKLYGVALH